VAETALAHADIQFFSTVTSIESSASLTKDANPRTVLRTSSGSTHTFDEVVITAPLGWLKRNKPAFTPPLPARIAQAIDNISYGRLEKVYITFPTAFWDSPPPTSTTPNASSNTHPSPSPIPTTTPPTSHYPPFTHFLTPTYAPHTNPSHWNQELINLASLPAHTAHPTLLFYIYGPCAQHIASLTAAHQASDSPAYLHALADFFRPYYSRLPHFAPGNADCQPVKALATQWAADPLAGWGSYCNFQISTSSSSSSSSAAAAAAAAGSRDDGNAVSDAAKGERMRAGKDQGGEQTQAVEFDKDIEALRAGMPERGVWLAGEHTAPFVALGTVTGAWWSGEGVARRIVAAYGYGSDPGKEQVNGDGGL